MHDYTIFFKNQGGFERVVKELNKKYQSLGSFGGIIKLKDINDIEAKSLSKFLGYSLNVHDDVNISIKNFLKIMNNSRFSDFDINTLVEEFLEIKLVSNKENKINKKMEEENFYNEFIEKSTFGNKWLKEAIETKNNLYNLIHKRYLQNKLKLHNELENIINLISNLPKKKELLSVYAAKYTGDPHYLDLDSSHCLLFLYALAYLRKCDYPKSRKDKIDLLSEYNIEIDNLSNFVITYNLITDKEYLNAFAKNRESLILNMQNILNVGKFDSRDKMVFVFENPSILNEIMVNELNVCVIVTNGFINYGVYLILEKLIESGNKLFYNGDFDPEGLIIASNLKEKFADKIDFINYSMDDYFNCLSNSEISSKRLNKLKNVNDKELQVVKELLFTRKLAGYQENNKERIIASIRKKLDN